MMTRGMRRVGGVLVLLAASLAACTETSSDTDGSDAATVAPSTAGAGSESTVGITPDAIDIAVTLPDTEELQKAGVVEQVGDRGQQLQVFADLANEAGGAAGRQLRLTVHEFAIPSTATDQRAACVAATEEANGFIVIFGGAEAEETLLCVTEEHERIGLSIIAFARAETYAAAGGRLFTNDMSANRHMENWVRAVDGHGLLDDASIGIVRSDNAAHEDVASSLKRALEDAGYEVTEDVALPCDATEACEQAAVGAERLANAGVDTVFSLLGAIPNPSFVGAAGTIAYHPQWLASDFEFQSIQTGVQLMEDVKDSYEGAIAITTNLATTEPDAVRTECNEQFTRVTGETFEPLSDGWQSVGAACLMIESIVEAADAAEESGGLTQASFIAAYEKREVVQGERRGAFGPDKHDAYDVYQLLEFDPGCVCWNPIEDTVEIDEG